MKWLAQVLQWVGVTVSRGLATFLYFEKSAYNAFGDCVF